MRLLVSFCSQRRVWHAWDKSAPTQRFWFNDSGCHYGKLFLDLDLDFKNCLGRRLQFFVNQCKFWIEFQQTAANFQQRRLCVLKILRLSLTFHKMELFSPKFSNFGQNFQARRFLTVQNLRGEGNCAPCLPLSQPHKSLYLLWEHYCTVVRRVSPVSAEIFTHIITATWCTDWWWNSN